MKNSQRILLWGFIFICILSVFSWKKYVSSADQSESIIEESIDKAFSFLDKPDSPGVAIVTLRGGKVLFKKEYGFACIEHGIPITTKTVFNIASLSKQFTAMAIALMVERGDLGLDDDIRKYIPELPEYGEEITISHLIHHTSGLREFVYVGMRMAGWGNEDKIKHKQILEMLYNQRGLNFSPGEIYSYCNTGYCLLAEIVSRISGMPFREWMKKNIFDPLEMNDTCIRDNAHMVIKNVANSYIHAKGEKPARYDYLKTPIGAGCVYSTIEDMTKWALNFEEGIVGGSKVFSLMRTRGILNNGSTIDYAFGQNVSLWYDLLKIDHSGAGSGWNSYFARFPKQKYSIIILANCEIGASHKGANINRVLLQDYINPAKKPQEQKLKRVSKVWVDVNPKILKSYVGVYKVRPSLYFRVEEKNETLWGGFTRRPKRRMLPVSDNEFFWMVPANDVKLSFVLDKNKNVSLLRLYEYSDGSKTILNRVDYVSYNLEKLRELTGYYYSEELQTTFSVEVSGDTLCLKHQKNEDVVLLHELDDFFVSNSFEPYWCEKVQFVRDKNNSVTGFLLSGYHVKNVKFRKYKPS